MGSDSAIEWTDATWNPVTGCTKISPGCKFCYAERLTERWGRGKFSDIVLHPDRLELPLRWRSPRRIFVNSMSDLFHEKIPAAFIDEVFRVMAAAPQHTFQVLTKRPERLQAWAQERRIPMPAHVWLGVSVESAAYAFRLGHLRQVDVDVRFMSAEPLLGSLEPVELSGLSWVITGGESAGAPGRALVERHRAGDPWTPKAEALYWIRDLRDRSVAAGIAFFHKQWGGPTPKSGGRTLDGQTWSQYPQRLAQAGR